MSVAPMTSRAAVGNAAGAFLLAAIVNSLLHEGAHAVAGLALGLTPTVTPFAVRYDQVPSTSQEIVVSLAGPMWSLVMGSVLLVVARSWGTGFARLFWLWLGFMGVMNFAGYLLIAPIVPAGDTARAMALLGAPLWAYVLIAVLGAAMQVGLAYLFAREVKRYTSGSAGERGLALLAWGAGTAADVVLSVVELLLIAPGAGAVVAVSLYALAVAAFAPMQFMFAHRVPQVPAEPLPVDRPSRAGLVGTALVAAVMVGLSAAGGVRLG